MSHRLIAVLAIITFGFAACEVAEEEEMMMEEEEMMVEEEEHMDKM